MLNTSTDNRADPNLWAVSPLHFKPVISWYYFSPGLQLFFKPLNIISLQNIALWTTFSRYSHESRLARNWRL